MSFLRTKADEGVDGRSICFCCLSCFFSPFSHERYYFLGAHSVKRESGGHESFTCADGGGHGRLLESNARLASGFYE